MSTTASVPAARSGFNAQTIGYWLTTGLLSFGLLGGGAMDIAQPPDFVPIMEHLGYPAYAFTLIGIWKILGAIALMAPRFPRLKEWAYAGVVIDLTGAVFSHLSVGDPVSQVVAPVVLLGITAASWWLRPAARRL